MCLMSATSMNFFLSKWPTLECFTPGLDVNFLSHLSCWQFLLVLPNVTPVVFYNCTKNWTDIKLVPPVQNHISPVQDSRTTCTIKPCTDKELITLNTILLYSHLPFFSKDTHTHTGLNSYFFAWLPAGNLTAINGFLNFSELA